jgi:RES domain-containing protein
VVNGEGAIMNPRGARYNYPGARAVYLAEEPLTCFAEKMFYFHRDALSALDAYHIAGAFPPFQQTFLLWEILFRKDIPDIFELSLANASAMNVYPTLMLNPSQDYNHLKDRRAAIQSSGYQGLRAPSSRVRGTGHMLVLFQDQSKNVQSITPHEVEFHLITSDDPPAPLTNHATDLLDFAAGEVRVLPGPNPPAPNPSLAAYLGWTRVEFNH